MQWHTPMLGLWHMIFVDLSFHLVQIWVGEEGLRFDQGDFLTEKSLRYARLMVLWVFCSNMGGSCF